MVKDFKSANCTVCQKVSDEKYHYVIEIEWERNKETVELWGITDNAIVTESYNKRIEDIIYLINHNLVSNLERPENKYYYPLRYFIKKVPTLVEKEIRNWFITGKFIHPEDYEMIYAKEAEFKTFFFYDKNKNVVIPLSQVDFISTSQEPDRALATFKTIFNKYLPVKARISTYYLVACNCLKLQWHILWFVKSYYTRYLLMEDSGIWPDQTVVLNRIFKFTCPVCMDKHSPAGILNFPKPFYERNKELLPKLQYNYYTITISDPTVKIQDPENISMILNAVCSAEHPQTITYKQYEKVLNNKELIEERYTYTDYVNMAKQLSENFVMPWEIKSSRELKTLHDNIIKEYNLRKNSSKQEIKDKYLKIKEEYPKYEIHNDKFLIKYPDDIDDLSTEGQSLHHCVGSYKNRVINKSAIILFLRCVDDPDSPFVTLHIEKKGDNYDLIQAHGVCNCSIKTIEGVYDFVKSWCNQFHIVMENIDRAI